MAWMMWIWLIGGLLVQASILELISRKLKRGSVRFISIPIYIAASGLAWIAYESVWGAIWRGFFGLGYIAWNLIGYPWLGGY